MVNIKFEILREEFIKEAQGAPKLFKDLAKVEQYIAESYKTRVLIELLQNADDAISTIFGLHSFDGGFIVGNNGRTFTIEDVEALCRSGSSNKQRGSRTIGYRGIGFKSVVNLARKIFVISGDFSFCFDKGITKLILQSNTDVPLIRVPHLMSDNDILLRNQVSELINKYHYTTVFVFEEVIKKISLDELSEFDRSSLLFLNNLKKVHIDYKNIERDIIVERLTQKERTTIRITEAEITDEWEVDAGENNTFDRVAFKNMQGIIVPALSKESMIHSFTPTLEFSGAYLKINGDYSTDPTRKAVDFDELSEKSFNNAISIIADSIISILSGDSTRKGFFSPFVNILPGEPSRFKSLLFKGLEEKLKKFSLIRLKPEWMNYEDYESICHNDIQPLKKEMITTYPELFLFLDAVNFRTLNLEEVIQHINDTEITINGSAQIFAKIIKQYRFDLDNARVEKLMTLTIFPVNNGFASASQIKDSYEISEEFISHLNSNTDQNDIAFFFKKLGIEQEKLISNIPVTNTFENKQIQDQEAEINSVFKTEPAIKKWRSTEQNTAEYLKALNVVLSVKDVTQANLGYDLEVMLTNGKRVYVEIKSVSSFSEPFKITNNEYSSAHNYGRDYLLAIVINEAPFQIKFIADPINTLSFEKKCEKWSWFCEQYIVTLQNVNQIFQ
jgi:hypothetical protein